MGRPDLAVTAPVQRVIDELHELYSRRGSKTHGRFSTDEDDYPMQRFLRDYVDGGGDAFGPMTERMMRTLETQARRKPNAGGGHVFFAHFANDKGTFLLIAILNDKLSAALTSSLDVQDIQHLDLDGFRFAGRINIDGWRAAEPRYIGFLKGKGDIAEYFREFLGCNDAVEAKAETRDLVDALGFYADARGMELEARQAFLQRAKDICGRSAKARTEISFEALANELVPDEPEGLLVVLVDPDRGLSDGFVPNSVVLGRLVSFKAKTSLWSLEFDRAALTTGQIEYNRAERTLTITDPPPELLDRLQGEMPGDG